MGRIAENEGHLQPRLFPMQALGQCRAAASRHDDVVEKELNGIRTPSEDLGRLHWAGHVNDGVAFLAQGALEQCTNRRIIFHEKDALVAANGDSRRL
jgi:hypothetical protein